VRCLCVDVVSEVVSVVGSNRDGGRLDDKVCETPRDSVEWC